MELKKHPKKDVSRYRTLFRNVGLIISLCLVITAFEWRWRVVRIPIPTTEIDGGEVIHVKQTRQDPPKRPKTPEKPVERPDLSRPIVTIDDSEPVDMPTPPAPLTSPDDIDDLISSSETIETVDNNIYELGKVDRQAQPLMGMDEWYRDLSKYLGKEMQRQNLTADGRMFVAFVIERDGSITDIQVLNGGKNIRLDALLIKGIRRGGLWSPAKQRSRDVRFRVKLPINFR